MERHEASVVQQSFEVCILKGIKGFLCAHEVSELRNPQKVRMIITKILGIFSAIAITETILRAALDSAIADFEDAVVEISSLKHQIDFIVTTNLSDFSDCRIPAIVS